MQKEIVVPFNEFEPVRFIATKQMPVDIDEPVLKVFGGVK